MPFVHGKNSVIYITDSGGTCRNVSGDLNNVALSWTRANAETTTFGTCDVSRLSGIRDATLTGAGFFNATETTSINAILEGLMAASLNSCIMYAVAGSVSGCPLYSGCFLISSFEVTGPIGAAVAISYAFQQSSGCLISGSVT